MNKQFLSLFLPNASGNLPSRANLLLLLVTTLSMQSVYAATSEIFISEYVEGSSFNKAIELYNGTGGSVDLAAGLYSLELYSNGAATANATLSLTGTIADGDVFVLAHASASAPVLAVADVTSSSVINFNGDDAVVLRKNGVVIDAFGQVGVDPGSQWPGGGQNDTLRRMDSVCAGDTNATDAFDASVEWTVFPQDTFDGLGSHTAVCGGGAVNLVINEILQNPSAVADSVGEWFEIYNPGSEPVDIDGWTISDADFDSHVINNGGPLVVPAGGYLVLGNNTDTGTNGGVSADYSYGSGWFLSNGGDEVILINTNQEEIDRVEYDGGPGFPDPTGASMALIDPVLDNNIAGNWCESSTAFGAGDKGTPGGANDCPGGVAEELLLSEVVVTPTAGEFIEIHNPGALPVDLSDVYLSDATFAGGGVYYYNLVTGSDAGGGGFGDFHARFPDGASIGPGEYQTVSLAGSDDFFSTFGTNPTYELYEDGVGADAIPDMREAITGSISGQGGLTNSGEMVVLYRWDGQSDLVTDLDYVVWGDKAEAVDKTGVAIDGPDDGLVTSAYLDDTAIALQDVLDTGAHAVAFSWQREDLTEGTEATSGGNGANGEDETSENLSVTWCAAPYTPNAATNCELPAPLVLIHDIQGSGLASTMDGDTVAIEGIVVGDFQDGLSGTNGNLNGFYVQEEDTDADADALTSEGIFVYEGGSPAVDVKIGDLVRVEGTVDEFFGFTELTIVTLVNVISSGNPLPAPTDVTLPVSSLDDFERFEGMYVTFPQNLFITEVSDFDRFNQVALASARANNATADYEPGLDAIQANNDYFLDRILLDDGRSSQNPDPALHPDGTAFGLGNLFRSGDTLGGVTGVMEFGFGQYRIQPTQGAIHTESNPRPAAPDDVGGSLKVASFNVLNFFTTLDGSGSICGPLTDQGCRGADNAEEFTRQRDKIISALLALDADIVGLIEIENHPGDVPTADLVSGLNDIAGAGAWDFIPTGAIGSDVIRQAFIYRPANATPDGAFAILDSSVDSTFNDDKNRPVLAQTFRDNATTGRLTVAVSHLKSKGAPCSDIGDPDTGDGSGNCNLTRTAAAQALVNWLAADPTGSGDDDFLILGDLNAYDREGPIDALLAGGYTDLADAFVGNDAYSFFFNGTGYLDYALAGANLVGEVTGATIWNINADETDLIDYNTDFKPDPNGMYAVDPYRASDHDPVLLGLNLVAVANLSISKADNADTVIPGQQVTYEIVVSNAGPDSDPAAVVTDTFADPLTCTYTSEAADGATGNTLSGSGNLSETLALPAGSSVTYTAICAIDPATQNGVLVNEAKVTSGAFDPDLFDNDAAQSADLTRYSDILISGLASADVVVAGTALTYTLTATNDGPSNAEDVNITSQLPPFTIFVSLAASAGGSCTTPAVGATGTVNCTWAGDTAPGGVHSIVLDVVIDPSAPNGFVIGETAVSGSSSQDPDDVVNSTLVETTVVTEAYWDVTMFWTDLAEDPVDIMLICDGIPAVSGVANPGVLTSLTASGWVNGDTSCQVAQNVPPGTAEQYSVDCRVDDVVSNTTYVCEIRNTAMVEEIPALNQLGAAILALLMLSVGLVGSRRFT